MAPKKKRKAGSKKKLVSRKPTAAPKRRKPAARKAGPKKAAARKAVAPRREAPIETLVPAAILQSPDGVERAFDALGRWFVEAMLGTANDDMARETIVVAITSFNDISEASGHPRGGAVKFFRVDAAGSHRPIPWGVLTRVAPPESVARWETLFDEVLAGTS